MSKENAATKKKSRAAEIWMRFRRNKIAMLGLIIFIIILLVMAFADVIVPYSVSITTDTSIRSLPPSSEHWFGTDNYGRDIFARIVHGSRNSLLVGFAGVIFGVLFGSVLGSAAGFYGGKDDIPIRCAARTRSLNIIHINDRQNG